MGSRGRGGKMMEILQKIKEKRPVLFEFLKDHQNDNVISFLKSQYKSNLRARPEIKEAIREEIQRVYREKLSLSEIPDVFNTADHMGPLWFPGFFDANIAQLFVRDAIFTLAYSTPLNKFPKTGYICGEDFSVSLLKDAKKPGETSKRSDGAFAKIPDIATITSKIYDKRAGAPLKNKSSEFKEKLLGLIKKAIPENQRFIDFAALFNRELLKQVLKKEVQVYYLSLEEVVRKVLLQYPDILELILSNFEKVIQEFRGIQGCWDEEKGLGTHFFWEKDKYLRRKRIYYQRPPSLKEILENLEKREIFPSIFTCYTILVGWGKLKCIGGFNQIQYLSEMEKGWREIFGFKDIPEIGYSLINVSEKNPVSLLEKEEKIDIEELKEIQKEKKVKDVIPWDVIAQLI